MVIRMFFTFIFLVSNSLLFSQSFITTWKTNNPSASTQTSITIPTFPGETYNYDVDWNNDGVFDEFGVTGNVSHDYGTIGIYTIAIRGTFPRIYFNSEGDNSKIISVDQWGNNVWTSMENAFFGCYNLVLNATDIPDLTLVINMDNMLNGPTTILEYEPLNSWDTSAVTSMRYTFANASDFNQNIGNWDTSNVTDMSGMFFNACHFQQDIGNWDTSNVTNMDSMFHFACLFNGDISGWDVSNVVSMNSMFNTATLFNRNIGNWNITTVTDMTDMFFGITLTIENYDNILIGWNSQSLQNGINFNGGNSTYCNSETARNNMIDSHSWVITDGGLVCSSLSIDKKIKYSFTFYPNPVAHILFIYDLNESSNIEILDITGKVIMQTDGDVAKKGIDVSVLKSTIYFMRVITANKVLVRKFIKK